jgi:hypothetical protein
MDNDSDAQIIARSIYLDSGAQAGASTISLPKVVNGASFPASAIPVFANGVLHPSAD